MEILLIGSCLLIFSFLQQSFWERISFTPNWGDNKYLILTLFFLYIFTTFKIFWKQIKNSYNNTNVITLYYFIFLTFFALIFTINNKEADASEIKFISLTLLLLTFISVVVNFKNNHLHNYDLFFSLIISFYLYAWTKEIKLNN